MRTVATVALLVLALTLAACGGDDDSGAEDTTTAVTETFAISETDYALAPSTVTVDAPGTYAFDVVNDGATDHALEIEGNGIEEETGTIAPGDSATVTVDLEAGTYEMYCPIGNHRALGMEGEISVSG